MQNCVIQCQCTQGNDQASTLLKSCKKTEQLDNKITCEVKWQQVQHKFLGELVLIHGTRKTQWVAQGYARLVINVQEGGLGITVRNYLKSLGQCSVPVKKDRKHASTD